MEPIDRIKTALGFRPQPDAEALIKEVERYQREAAELERQLHGYAEQSSLLAASDEELDSVRLKLEEIAAAEARVKAMLLSVKTRIEDRQRQLRVIEDARAKAVKEEEEMRLVADAKGATADFGEFVSLVKRACGHYRLARKSMQDAERRAVAVGVEPTFMHAIENRAVTFMLHELYEIFGSHSHRIRVQSAPSAIRHVDHVEHLAALLARQLRGGGQNGNGRMDGENQELNLSLETESADKNDNGGAE
jgi:hypothetical protein